MKIVCQRWALANGEVSRYSLHLNLEDRKKYIEMATDFGTTERPYDYPYPTDMDESDPRVVQLLAHGVDTAAYGMSFADVLPRPCEGLEKKYELVKAPEIKEILVVKDKEYFMQVVNFAITNKQLDSLLDGLIKLTNLFGPDAVKNLMPDPAPYSFYFTIYRGERMIVNGGLIYHRSAEWSGAYPVLSVTLAPYDGWLIHT